MIDLYKTQPVIDTDLHCALKDFFSISSSFRIHAKGVILGHSPEHLGADVRPVIEDDLPEFRDSSFRWIRCSSGEAPPHGHKAARILSISIIHDGLGDA